MGILAYLIAGIALVAAVVGGYMKIHHDGYTEGAAETRVEWNAANAAQRDKEAKQSTAAAKTLEVKREKAKVVYETITRDVEKIVERPIYRSVCLDPDGLRDARAAINGQGADRLKPDKAVPGAKPAG